VRRQSSFLYFALTVLAVMPFSGPAAALESPSPATPTTWRDLDSPAYLAGGEGAIYYTRKLKNGSRAHIVIFELKPPRWQLKPAVSTPTAPTSEVAAAQKASAAVNGGFFNLSDGDSTSYVVVDGKQLTEPKNNKALTGNPKLAPYLEAIYNRSELRVLEGEGGKRTFQIAAHNDPLPAGTKLRHSLQGGPLLLPVLKDRQEAFVRLDPDGSGKEIDSIGCNKPAARTAFGITSDGFGMLVCVAGNGQDPESSGITLPALAELLKSLGASEAINFDGGASSTMYVRLKGGEAESADARSTGKSVCGKTPETRVKSALLLAPEAER